MVDELLFKDECFTIVGLCMKVHRTLGKGFKEAVYKDALEIEFQKSKIPYEREKKFKIGYENIVLAHTLTPISWFIILSFWKLRPLP